MEALLSIKSIHKSFGATIALKKIDLEIPKGKITSILGENGAGKSTLMKIISGNYPHNSYSGQIYLNGELCSFSNPKDSFNKGISMLHQELTVELDLSVTENIFIGNLPTKSFGIINWKSANEEATKLLSKLYVNIDVKKPLRMFSTSIQQLVCIARAIAVTPKILILDEPTASLTESESAHLFEVLNSLKKNDNITCIYISHKLKEVIEISDNIVVLRDGIVVSNYKERFFDEKQIIQDIVGKKIDDSYIEKKFYNDDIVLELENFSIMNKSINNNELLSNVSLKLKKGEILGLVGLVGTGRSELLKSIIGAYPKKSGKIYINNKTVKIKSPKHAHKYKIGMLTEDRKRDGYIPTMSIKNNLTISILHKVSKYSIIKKMIEKKFVEDNVDSLQIKIGSINDNILSLSGGNQQKVLFAKLLALNLNVLLLDEPTRGVDIGTKFEIYSMIQSLAKNGVSIIMVSSELPELLQICNRFLVINNNTINKEFNRDDVNEEILLHSCNFTD